MSRVVWTSLYFLLLALAGVLVFPLWLAVLAIVRMRDEPQGAVEHY